MRTARGVRLLAPALVLLWIAAACDRGSDAPAPQYVAQTDLTATIAQLGAEEQTDVDEAIERLGGLGDAAVPALETAIAHEKKPIALAAIEALGNVESPRADAALAAVATKPGDDEVRATAVLHLGQGQRPAARPVLEAALRDASPMVRQTAAFACGPLCTSPDAVDRLVDLALGEVPDAELGRIRSTLVRIATGPDQAAAARVRDVVGRRTTAMRAPEESLERRTRAALIAADVGATDAEPVLIEAARGTTSLMLRLAAIQWLGKHGTGAAVPALDDGIQDRTIAAGAAVALQQMAGRGVAEARDALARIKQRASDKPAG